MSNPKQKKIIKIKASLILSADDGFRGVWLNRLNAQRFGVKSRGEIVVPCTVIYSLPKKIIK